MSVAPYYPSFLRYFLSRPTCFLFSPKLAQMTWGPCTAIGEQAESFHQAQFRASARHSGQHAGKPLARQRLSDSQN
jgi:hypothetical protein